MKVYKVTPGKGCNPYCEIAPETVLDVIEESEIGDIVTVEIIDISEEKYKNASEYEGP